MSGRDAWRWHLPARWRWPLVAWALVVAASWPFVFLREVDFYLGILPLPGVANTSIGITPWEAVTGGHLLDAGPQPRAAVVRPPVRLVRRRSPVAFRKAVLLPLAGAIAIACGVGAYQAFVDLRFLNPHLWPHMGRASGTLGDANTLGMMAALWGPASIVLARRWPAPWSIVGGVAGVGMAMMGVLTSGSRTGADRH